ncbi:hypothetical protein [Escherichia coli]|uniref:hypothetical protein n=1 Tax=Escherichia coli TaxID=562 RepID=UPI0006A25266|nr:hypothetical protein [Escherichia coli]CTW61083.1 truncated TraD [Escherichia coli]CTW62995.1 truncated TraD [Escherichia coli]CTZ35993.1 truncated TraD [Escherichia coli]
MLPDELEKRLDGIEDASKKGYPVRNLYKIACEPGLWLQAYVNIRANAGALTQGVSTDTIDGFSIERAEKLAKTLRSREYVAKPVRRGKRKLTAVCSHQTRIGNLDAHLI